MRISSTTLTIETPDEASVEEASYLGLPPGCWPQTLIVTDSLGIHHHLRRRYRLECGGFSYSSRTGRVCLYVLND